MSGKNLGGAGMRKRTVKNTAVKKDVVETDEIEYQEMLVKRLRNSLDDQIHQILIKVESQILGLKQQVIQQVENTDMLNERHVCAFKDAEKQLLRIGGKEIFFHEKNFKVRDSLLTELFRVPHIRTIYHIFVAFLVNLVVNTILQDYVKEGRITVGFRLIYGNFKDLPAALLVWFGMQMMTILVYCSFSAWRAIRTKVRSSACLVRIWDSTSIILMFLYVVTMLTVPTCLILKLNFTVVLSFALLMEQVRFIMKSHAFVRTCAPRILALSNREKSPKGKNPAEEPPNFRKFIYFQFIPTLIYRDEYPRTSHVRWRKVMFHFAEIIGVIFFLAFVYENYMLPLIQDFGKAPKSMEDLLVVFFGINTPALVYFLSGFFLLLHSWMNAFAEMLRFGDRMFYQDWWNSGSFPEYYKKWNVIVHDWLYTYIYRDTTLFLTKSKAVSTWVVFITSALFHEFVLAFSFRFFYPVLFIVFGILTTSLYFIPRRFFVTAGNFIIWLMLVIGIGFCASLYFLEYFARINCPPASNSPVVDFFIPRSWTCGIIR